MSKFEEAYQEEIGMNFYYKLKEAHDSDAVEADNIITELWKALEITMQAYHDTHPKYIMAEKALKKARGEKWLYLTKKPQHWTFLT